VNQAMKSGATPLFMASQEGHLEITRLLLEHGAAIYQATSNGATPLSVARHGGHSRIVQLLQEHGADTA
jgi:ankyrin